jgi:hypothetical protein
VSVELARRLIQSGAVASEEVERALFETLTTGVAFAQALASRGSDVLHVLERELAKTRVPLARVVRVAPELTVDLPLGMCERLLAVPIGRDAKSGAVDLACVDPLDPQVGSEMAHHLKGPVRVFRAPLTEVLLAIELWLDERDTAQSAGLRTPAFGTKAVKRPSSPAPARLSLRPPRALVEDDSGVPISTSEPPRLELDNSPSEPPIPLVRRSLVPEERPVQERLRKGTDPGVGTGSVVLVPETDEAGQPVIGLFRAKPQPAAVQISGVAEETMREALARLERAKRPEEVVAALVHGSDALATRTLVLASRGGAYEGRAGSASLGDADRLRRVRVDAGQSSAFEAAAQAGYYLGMLPQTPAHEGLRELFGDGEVYVARIEASGRPALFLVLAGMETAFGASRRADELARAASRAIERIVLSRKQSG